MAVNDHKSACLISISIDGSVIQVKFFTKYYFKNEVSDLKVFLKAFRSLVSFETSR